MKQGWEGRGNPHRWSIDDQVFERWLYNRRLRGRLAGGLTGEQYGGQVHRRLPGGVDSGAGYRLRASGTWRQGQVARIQGTIVP